LPAASLDLESPGLRERLVEVPASHGDILDGTAGLCDPSELLVDSRNPIRSLMLTKELGGHSCGGVMPVAPRTITPAELGCLQQWVFRLAGW
jgi:hypothetical protein